MSLLSHPVQKARRGAPRFRVYADRPGPWLQIGSITAFEWNRIDLCLDHLPASLAGMRIAHLSDFHMRPKWCSAYDTLIERLRLDPPDLIAVSGDFMEHRADHRKALPALERLMRQLCSRHGIWGILGNHDGDLLAPRLQEWGVHVICGRMARLESQESAIELIGVPSVSRKDLCDEFVRSLVPAQPSVPRIVLTHFPDSVLKLAGVGADLILGGHTHGGQVCLPGGYPIVTHDALPRRMSRGVHSVHDTLLIVNRGLGFASVPLRLFCPPEVIEVRLLNDQSFNDPIIQ